MSNPLINRNIFYIERCRERIGSPYRLPVRVHPLPQTLLPIQSVRR